MTAQKTSLFNAFETQLSASVGAADLTFNVDATAPLTSPCYLVVDPTSASKREYVLFDGTFTSTAFVTTSTANRGLGGSAAGAQAHAAGTTVRCVPMHQHFGDLNDRIDVETVLLAGAQTITGTKTFSVDPMLADGSSALSLAEGNAAYVGLTGDQTVAGNKTLSGTTDLATVNVDSLRVKVPWFDVKHPDYGATGDGTTDDRAAIQAAIDAAVAAGGGAVFFPKGTYQVSASLTVGTDVALIGIGFSSVIRGTSLTSAVIRSPASATRYYRWTLRDLKVDNTARTAAGGIGLDLTLVTSAHLDNVQVANVETGVKISGTAYYNHFFNVSVLATGTGFSIAAGANENHLWGGRVNDSTTGILIDDVTNVSVNRTSVEVFTTGISIAPVAATSRVGISGVRLENTPTSGTGILNSSLAQGTYIIMPHTSGLTTAIDDSSTTTVALTDEWYGDQIRTDRLRFGSGGAAYSQLYSTASTVSFRNSADSGYVSVDLGSVFVRSGLEHIGSTAGFYGVAPVSRPTALTAADAATVDSTYGTEEAGVINNLRTRVNELETKLRSLGLLS